MLHGTCAFYNRLDGGMLCSVGMWNAPPGYPRSYQPEGYICNDVIRNGGSSPAIITDLMRSSYADSDPNVRRYNFQTYIGVPVKIGKEYIGSVCVVYQDIYSPSPQDLETLTFLAKAVAIEDERRITGQALRAMEEKYHRLFDSMTDAFVRVELDGRITLFNKVYSDLVGYTPEELKCLTYQELTPEKWHAMEMEIIEKQVLVRGHSDIYEKEYQRKDGTVIPVELHTYLMRDDAGRPEAMWAIVRDITGRKRAENELQKLYGELEKRVVERTAELSQAQAAYRQANERLNLLSSITRHDILNQLMALSGFLEISRMKAGHDAAGEYIRKAQRAAATIERYISFTKLYQDIGVKSPVWQNVRECVQKPVADLLPVSVSFVVNLDDIGIYADALFEKVFYNLIDNSLKYGGEQLRSIRISSLEVDDGLVITYEDDGVGIQESDRPHLFEKGFGKNTGLGLFLSREILSITGITIAETGTPGKGARFEISVPNGAYRFA